MPDPFAAGLTALHKSALGLDARYMAQGEDPLDLRVIRSQGSAVRDLSVLDRDSVSILAADVAQPVRGDQLQLIGTVSVLGTPHTDPVFRIAQDPLLDDEGLSWDCAIELA